MLLPGASKDKKSALLEKSDTTSVFVVLPTLTALPMQPGELRPFLE